MWFQKDEVVQTQMASKVDRPDFIYDTLPREVIEILVQSFGAKDIESIGRDLYGQSYTTQRDDYKFSDITISANTAAFSLVSQCRQDHRLEELLCYLIRLEGNLLNSRIVNIFKLENLLQRIAQNGFIYEFKENEFRHIQDDVATRPDWGALKHGKVYPLTVVSVDICKNSLLVKKYGSTRMEAIFGKLQRDVQRILSRYNGRIWAWSGDGGLIAFRDNNQALQAFLFALELQLFLPILNMRIRKSIQHNIKIRIAMDKGDIKFVADTGHIISPVINFACHLQEEATPENGIGISEVIRESLPKEAQIIFQKKEVFENRTIFLVGLEYQKLFSKMFLAEEKLDDKLI